MLRIHLILFALYRDLAGTNEVQAELAAGATAQDLVDLIRARGGQLEQLPREPVVAVNREYATLDQVLQDGDEVAFLPPVAGG